ncbi:MAG: transmembrane 9 family protein [Chloroflexi bacterium]|nr:hypothetical protein [Anaerolineaceae bacterium]NMB90414.1 transmembrane 9 family protein [Chloroflexota bacterium]
MEKKNANGTQSNRDLVALVFKGVGLAMAVATIVLNILGTLSVNTAISLLSIGLLCVAIAELDS